MQDFLAGQRSSSILQHRCVCGIPILDAHRWRHNDHRLAESEVRQRFQCAILLKMLRFLDSG